MYILRYNKREKNWPINLSGVLNDLFLSYTSVYSTNQLFKGNIKIANELVNHYEERACYYTRGTGFSIHRKKNHFKILTF